MVPPSSDRIPRVPPYSRSSAHHFRIREFHPLRYTFPDISACTALTFGLLPVRSPLLRKSLLMSFPQGTEMFHFPWFALYAVAYSTIAGGLPHSDIPDSCAPYRLIWAFRRLVRPSSPPAAMASATCAFFLDHTTRIDSQTVCSCAC